jgi:hypothetical protein
MPVVLSDSSYASCAAVMSVHVSSLTQIKHFSTSIFEAPDDDHIDLNMECNNDVKNNLKFENINFKVLTQVYM